MGLLVENGVRHTTKLEWGAANPLRRASEGAGAQLDVKITFAAARF